MGHAALLDVRPRQNDPKRRRHARLGLGLGLGLALTLVACAPRGGDRGELLGTWESDTPRVRLELEDQAYRLESGDLVKWGTLQRTPFRVAFVLERTSTPAFERYCREEVDTYDWRIDDGELTFRAVGETCDRQARTVLVAGAWRKASP